MTDLLIQKCHNNMVSFARALYPGFVAYWHTKKLIDILEKVEQGELDRVMIQVPPRHGKSLVTSQLFPAYFAGRNPDKKIILAAGTDELAEEFGANCRNFLEDPTFSLIFPECQLRKDSRSKTRFHFGKKGYAYFMGRRGQITGRGAHLLLIDDLTKSATDAESEASKKEVRMWYKQNAYNRLEKGGRIVIIGTRWREDDIQGWLLDPEEQEKVENWHIFKFPAIAEEEEEFRKIGDPLCPDLVPLELLLKNQELDRRGFAGIFQQRPSLEEGNIIQRPWLKIEKLKPELLKPPRILALDTAFKEGSKNDYNAATIGQRYDLRHVGILYAEQRRADFPKLIDWIVKLINDWKIQGLVIEDAASGQSVIQTLKKVFPYLPIVPMKIQKGLDKESRVHAITPFLESGGVLFDKWVPAHTQDELFHNLLSFPAGKHDDLTDSFTHLVTYLLRGTLSMRKISGRGRTINIPSIYSK
jgi:predicted phage terminase large subunit-like protein